VGTSCRALAAIEQRPKSTREVAEVDRLCRQARLLASTGELGRAEATLREAVSSFPNRPQVLQNLGWLYKRWDPPRAADARDVFQRAHELNYRSRELYWHWADLEYVSLRYKDAAEVAERGLVRMGRDLSLYFQAARARFALSQDYQRQLASETAMDQLSRVLEHVAAGARVSAPQPELRRIKSRLLEIGMRAARQHKTAGAVERIKALWREELPGDPYLEDYQ
jgi:Flp pilus assembly protein TadD